MRPTFLDLADVYARCHGCFGGRPVYSALRLAFAGPLLESSDDGHHIVHKVTHEGFMHEDRPGDWTVCGTEVNVDEARADILRARFRETSGRDGRAPIPRVWRGQRWALDHLAEWKAELDG